jgi:phage FluMu protein Com
VSNEVQDVRCSACGKLLAKLQEGSLMLQRSDLKVTIDGEFSAAFICGHPNCRHLNVIRVRSQHAPSVASDR